MASGIKATAMKKEIYIQIPEPCHEDWDRMTPVQQGRYCQSCCKDVIDFSLMTDREIINFLSKPQGKTCGNFSNDQLNRVIAEPATPAKKKVWAVMLSFLMPLVIAQKASAQRGKLSVKQKEPVKCVTQLRGDTIASVVSETITIEGKIRDTLFNPVPFATVLIKGTVQYTVADSAGNYSLKNVLPGDITLSVSSVGFHMKEIRVPSSQPQVIKNVSLDPEITKLPEIVITSFPLISCGRIEKDIVLNPEINSLQNVTVESSYSGRMAGGLSVCSTRILKRSIKDTIVEVFKPSVIKAFPNPAPRGGHVLVQVNVSSDYQLKLFNNQSQLILETSFTIAAKNQSYQLELPPAVASGMYYINVIDTKTKKQYTQKLIIQ
jgi:hypothetical protein